MALIQLLGIETTLRDRYEIGGTKISKKKSKKIRVSQKKIRVSRLMNGLGGQDVVRPNERESDFSAKTERLNRPLKGVLKTVFITQIGDDLM